MKRLLILLILLWAMPAYTSDDVILNLSLDQEVLPADGHSTAVLSVQVSAPDNLIDAVVSHPVQFSASAGEFVPDDTEKWFTLNNDLQIVYRSGMIDTQTEDVTLRVFIDVPELGEIAETITIRLLREELRLSLDCTAVTSYNTQAIPIGFYTNQAENSGEYTIGINIEGNSGGVSTALEQSANTSLTMTAQAGEPFDVFFTPPPGDAGSTRLCAVVDGRQETSVCRQVAWGSSAESINQLDISQSVRLGQPFHIQVGLQAGTTGLIAYQAIPSGNLLAWDEGRCNVFTANPGYREDIEAIDDLTVLEWQLAIPGEQNVTAFTVIAYGELLLSDPSSVIPLSQGASLQFNSGMIADNFVLYAASPLNNNADQTQVLVRVYVEAGWVDAARTRIVSPDNRSRDNRVPVSSDGRTPNMVITMPGTDIGLFGVSNRIIEGANGTLWQAVYIQAQVDTALIQPKDG